MSYRMDGGSVLATPHPPLAGWRGLSRTSSVTLALGVIGYRFLVDLSYQVAVADTFSYQGFKNEPTVLTILLSWIFLLALLPLLLRVIRSETLSGQITTLLALVSLVPTTTLIAHSPGYSAWYVLLLFVYWLLFLLTCVFLPSIKLFRRPFRSEIPHLVTLTVFSATVLYLSWRHTGFRLHFGVFDVYELRAEAREYEVAAILGYFANIADNALPVLLAFYLRRGWRVVAAAVAVVMLFNFGISATKQVLFLLIFALGSAAVRDRSRLGQKILPALAAVVSLGIIEWVALGTLVIGSLFLHRLLFLTAQLHWVYYQFFQTNELLYLTQSGLRFFFDSPYQENVQFLLGEYFIGEIAARANNGLFSDGYMNFGAASVLFYPVLCVVVLKLLEGASKGLSKSVHFVIILVATFVFQGVPIPTALLSSGIAFLIILLPTLPREHEQGRVAAPVAAPMPT